MSDRTCTHPGCDNPHDWRGYCRTHNSRIRTHGDPYGKRCETCRRPLEQVFTIVRSQQYCSLGCRPQCAVEGCENVERKLGWCASHYSQSQRIGSVRPFVRKWGPAGGACKVCGDPAGARKQSRQFCSAACERLWRKHKGQRPTSYACALCGTEVSLLAPGKGERLRSTRSKLCAPCARESRFGVTVEFLAERDGTACSICGEQVDMTIRRVSGSMFFPSIDHVKPRAHGGTNDPDNLALAHFRCNAVKSDREAFTI